MTASNRLEDTIDWLLPMLAYFSTNPWRSADDWQEAIEHSFGVTVSLHDVGESIRRLQERRILLWDGGRQEFALSEACKGELGDRIESAQDLEDRVREKWLETVSGTLPASMDHRAWWGLLMDYSAAVFRAHGMDAVAVLGDEVPTAPSETHARMLELVLEEHHVPSSDWSLARHAFASFFQSADAEINSYISQLADSTYNLLALCLDDETRQALASQLPQLKVFVDTNILFALLGTHDTPLAAAALDLFRVIGEGGLPFTLYYHEKTLSELTHTIDDACYRLRRQTWSQHVSKAAVGLPWQVLRLTGIEMRFHQLNAVRPTDPSAFCARYQSPAALLADHGLRIYREPDLGSGQERLELKATMIADYKEFLSRNPRRRNAAYAKFDHDCSLWMVAKDQQAPSRKGVLFSGAFVLTSDYLLWRFDKEVMRDSYKTKPVVVLPDAFLQALRPFVGATRFSDAAFVQAFTASEFRASGDSARLAQTVRRVMSYLAAFDDLPEETASRILTDAILMEAIQRYEENAPEFTEALENAIFAHNEALIRERDELLSERRGQLHLVEEALQAVSAQDANTREILTSLQDALSANPQTHIQVYGGIVSNSSIFNNSQSQVGAQGPGASASGNTFHQQSIGINADPLLLDQLVQVKEHLLKYAKGSGDYEEVAAIQGAIEAIEKEDEPRAASFLRRAGQKVMDVALEIGAKAVAAAIQGQLGIG